VSGVFSNADVKNNSERKLRSKKICGHPWMKSVTEQSGGGRYLSQSYKDEMKRKIEYHLHKFLELEKVRI